ncbi:RagB/SusD family nutrient uptake outer membrane protein [Reichenbachiella carrageenanivorans]|uniref:RagB/SusD family nutrient uptake outer membrane protein n=1 Tax=Reichenbachiella carrageenanivorans TaxID=2979869 RepID=A0ABY6D491_9BACT|nr:RagB/SusD family nutrient uptake outer membrane protein [Reichenbachiella carrageenanivorans]UXX80962.1 RagB/SusD family nutrient uptake outer membrane protein [Reichenbachiella carrageenanivorans]
MKNKILIILFLGVIGYTISGCDDFLEVEAPHLSDDNALKEDPTKVLGLVYAAYKGVLNDYYTGGNQAIAHVNNDINFHNGTSAQVVSEFNYNPSFPVFNNMWSAEYAVISSCNIAIKFIDELIEDEKLKESLIAESKALRGYSYFNLYRLFGTVPLSLKAVTDIDSPEAQEELRRRRATLDEFDDYFVTELTEAIAGLPESGPLSSDEDNPYILGRFTKDAARFVLAKYYLYRGSEMQKNGEDAIGFFQKTIDIGNEILGTDPANPPRYRLMDWYPSVFHLEWERENTEWLMRVRQESGPDLSIDPRNAAGVPQVWQVGLDGGGFATFQSTRWGYNMFEFGDSTRRRWLNCRIDPKGGKNYKGEDLSLRSADWPQYYRSHPKLDTGDSTSLANFTYLANPAGNDAHRIKMAKFRMFPVIGEAEGNWIQYFPDDDRYMFRLAEVYLMVAEAMNEVNGNPSAVNSSSGWNAFDYVNIIRKRARNHSPNDFYDEFSYDHNALEVAAAVIDWSPGNYGNNEYISSKAEFAPAYTSRLRVDKIGEEYGYGSDYEAFRWEILWERARELTGEDICRLGDLRRRGILVEAMSHANHEGGFWLPNKAQHPGAGLADENEYLFPIPSAQLQANPGLVQNPGY